MITARKVARDLLVETEQNIDLSRSLAKDRIAQIVAEHGSAIVLEAIENAMQSEWASHPRQSTWKPATVLKTGETSTPRASLRQGIDQLLNYPMANGRMLRTYTHDELVEYSDNMHKSGESMILRARWFSLIAKEIKGTNKTVGAVLKHADLDRLKRRAERQAAAA